MFFLLIAEMVKVKFCLKLRLKIWLDPTRIWIYVLIKCLTTIMYEMRDWYLPEDDIEVALQHGLGGQHDQGGHPSLLLLPIVSLHQHCHHCPLQH